MPKKQGKIRTVDVHTGGDVHQIIVDGVIDLPGRTVGDKMAYLKNNGDGLRRLLLHEPRGGHPSHYADLVVAPSIPGAKAGFVIMEYMGYPLYSGSNTMATAIALLEDGHLPMAEGRQDVLLESPGGAVTVTANCRDGKVIDVSYKPDSTAFVAQKGLSLDVPGRGAVKFDVVWSGCFYSLIDGPSHGFALTKSEEAELGAFALDFMAAARDKIPYRHFELGDQGPAVFVLWTGPAFRIDDQTLGRRISPVVYPKSVSRCPSGTGTTAAIAQLVERGEMRSGDRLKAISCWDTEFEGHCYEVLPYGPGVGCRVEVTGDGWIIARKEVIVNFDDPLTPGDGLKEILA